MPKLRICAHGVRVGSCRVCRSEYERTLRKRDPAYAQRQRDSARAWRKAHPDRVRQHAIEKRDRERLKTSEQRNAKHYRSKYGLTVDQVKALHADGCAICGSRDRPHIDHDHATDRVRGSLCHSCNIGLGFIERPGDWLALALAYLRRTSGPADGRE